MYLNDYNSNQSINGASLELESVYKQKPSKSQAKAEEKPSPLSLVATAVHPSLVVLISLPLLLIFGFVLWRDQQKRGIADG